MRYYEITKDSIEIGLQGSARHMSWTSDDILDAYYRRGWGDQHRLERFPADEPGALDRALKSFEENKRSIGSYVTQGDCWPLLNADLLFLELNEYEVDEEGWEDFDQGEILDLFIEEYTPEGDEE